jgi:hypothetical protein
MRHKKTTTSVAGVGLILIVAGEAYASPIAPNVELGSASPQNWAVLDMGNFSLSNPTGSITGHLGDVFGNVTTGGSAGIKGTVTLGTGASYSGSAPSGGIVQNNLSPLVALAQANIASAYYNALGLAPNFRSAPAAGAVAPGVYAISGNWSPNGGTYTLQSGQVYVFDISGNFSPSTGLSALLFKDATPWDVIFNVAGNVQSSGGSSTSPTIDGILLAHGQISLTPGSVDGEIISDTSINIASGGSVAGVTPVPEPTTLIAAGLLLLPLAASTLRSLRRD